MSRSVALQRWPSLSFSLMEVMQGATAAFGTALPDIS
jgi:hypothetical protein